MPTQMSIRQEASVARFRRELKRLAKKEGSLAQVARLSGIHPVTVYRYATQSSVPSMESLRKLASVGLDVQYVLTGQKRRSLSEDQVR